jgi:hypothetical protein
MGKLLGNCLESIRRHCQGFDIALAEDQSDDPETLKVVEKYLSMFSYVYSPKNPKNGERHGHLYENIQKMCRYAISKGYKYIFLVQDDMQFVRPFDNRICKEYNEIFNFNNVIQVDPRFLRHAGAIDIREDMRAYSFSPNDDRRSYADVGILNLDIIKEINWKFFSSERENKIALSKLGYLRIFPFTPIIMHVPFPTKYSKGRKRIRLFPIKRGIYTYRDMTEQEIKNMDERDINEIPYYKKYITPINLGISILYYKFRKDRRIFG